MHSSNRKQHRVNVNNSFGPDTVVAEISSAWRQRDEREPSQASQEDDEPNGEDCPFWLPSTQRCTEVLSIGLNCFAEAPPPFPVNVRLRFATSAESRELNQSYRGKANPTNVLSFPAANLEVETWPPVSCGESETSAEAALLGDLVFCPEIVAAEAAQQGKNIADHWTHLLLHGLFHLLGYDHLTEEDASEMEALEIRALERLGITNPYLLD